MKKGKDKEIVIGLLSAEIKKLLSKINMPYYFEEGKKAYMKWDIIKALRKAKKKIQIQRGGLK